MGLIAEFLGKRPPGEATQRRHESGRSHTNGYLNYDELNARLVGQAGLRVFDKMFRTDPECRKALIMLWAPIAAAAYEVEPAGADDDSTTDEDREVRDYVEWLLFEKMQPKLPGHLWEVGRVAGRSGFAPFEIVYKRCTWRRTLPREKPAVDVNPDDPLDVTVEDAADPEFEEREVIAVEALDLRLPRSIQRWVQDGPRLTQLEQFVTEEGIVTHDMRDIVYYRFGAEGDNWEGESLLRPAYKHWKYKEVLELIDSIRHERFAIGVPTAYPPTGGAGAQQDQVVEMLKGIRANEQSFILAPGPKQGEGTSDGEGWLFEILQPQSGGEGDSILESLKYHKDAIAASVIAEFMRLGQETVGARATAETQEDPFHVYTLSIANGVVVDAINTQLIPRMVALNFETDRMPRLKISLLDQQTLSELKDFISGLGDAITLDDDLEDHLRERAHLPPADPAVRARKRALADQRGKAELEALREPPEAPGAPPGGAGRPPGPAGRGGRQQPPPAKKTLSAGPGVTRSHPDVEADPLAHIHRHMQLDQLADALDGAKERMEAVIRPFAIRAAAAARAGAEFDGQEAMTAAVANEIGALRLRGYESVLHELESQGAPVAALTAAAVALGAVGAESDRDLAQAAIIVTAVLAAVALHVGQAKTALLDDAAALQEIGENAALRVAREAGQEGGPSLVAAGRREAEALHGNMILGTVYTAILDTNACRDCRDAVDGVVRPLTDPIRLRRRPPNPACRGRGRCRCLEFYVYAVD